MIRWLLRLAGRAFTYSPDCGRRAPRRADLRCTRPRRHDGVHLVVDHADPRGPRPHVWDD